MSGKNVTSTCRSCGERFSYVKGRGRDRLYCSQRCMRKLKKSHAVAISPETYKRLERLKAAIESTGMAVTFSGLLRRAIRLLEEQERTK